MEDNSTGPVPEYPPFYAFEERKRELLASKNRWRNWFLLNICILLLITFAAFLGLFLNFGLTALSWLELALALPLTYSAIFFHAQHNREREFLEEYSFKSVVARSFGAYLELLRADVDPKQPAEQGKLLDFVVDSVKNLHTPPRAIISKHPLKSEEDVKIGVIEKLADVFKKFVPGRF